MLDHGNFSLEDDRKLDGALIAELETWGQAAGEDPRLSAFLLWENAD